jgi:hypothetical protein
MTQCQTTGELLSVVWPALVENIKNSAFRTCNPQSVLLDIARGWISAERFYELLKLLTDNNARFGLGKKPRLPKIEHTVELCENALGFEGALAVGAVAEFSTNSSDDDRLVSNLRQLQKSLRYGLSSPAAITFYELGFSDRVISTELSTLLPEITSRSTAIEAISSSQDAVREMLRHYPKYFTTLLEEVLT